jgi:hypothetical protein
MEWLHVVPIMSFWLASILVAESTDVCTAPKDQSVEETTLGGAALVQFASMRVKHTHLDEEEKDSWLSRRDSLGFITESNQSWRLRKQIHQLQMKREIEHRNDCNSCGVNQGHIWFQDHYEPSFHCEFEERIGQMGDGGKWICDPERIRQRKNFGEERCLVYSVGSNGDFSFEESVLSEISKDCEVHTFDPMEAGKWKTPSHVQYHSVALGMKQPAKPLAELVKELGHTGRRIDLFKIDCEGCEWETYKSWFGSGVDIRQILVELHWRASPEKAHAFFNFLFEQGYVIFNKEPNTLGCRGDCIEYSFLKMAPSFSHDI